MARYAGANLTRGDYARLAKDGLCDHDAIFAAPDKNILDCVDSDPIRFQCVRRAAEAMKADERGQAKIDSPVLEPYEG